MNIATKIAQGRERGDIKTEVKELRVITTKGEYKIARTAHDYIVINAMGDYENHAHFDSYQGAITCIDLVQKKKVPYSSYLSKAACRLTTDEEYRRELERLGEKRRAKQRYININKGTLKK